MSIGQLVVGGFLAALGTVALMKLSQTRCCRCGQRLWAWEPKVGKPTWVPVRPRPGVVTVLSGTAYFHRACPATVPVLLSESR